MLDKTKGIDDVDFYLLDLKSKFDKIKPNTYFLSYSGGKDSHFLYWFIKEYLKRDDIKIVGVNTYMEHHEILQRIKKNCDVVLLPNIKPFEIKEKYGSPCFSKIQDEFIKRYQNGSRTENTMNFITRSKKTMFQLSKKASEYVLSGKAHKISPLCCNYLKKEPVSRFKKETGLKPILGVRGTESITRKSKYKSCFTKDKTFTPIHDLSDELLEKIIQKYDIEVPEVYKHINRTGCMGCPYGARSGNTTKELALISENQKKFVCQYFKESYEILGINTEVATQTTIDDYM